MSRLFIPRYNEKYERTDRTSYQGMVSSRLSAGPKITSGSFLLAYIRMSPLLWKPLLYTGIACPGLLLHIIIPVKRSNIAKLSDGPSS